MHYTSAILSLVLLILLPESTLAQGSGGGARKNYQAIWLSDCEKMLEEFRKENEAEPVQSFLPFWGKSLREEGYSLPLPMGVGASLIAMQQTNTINEFNLLVDNTQVPLDLRVYNAQSVDFNFTFRPDIWVFPFLNVYGVLGYTQGSVRPNVIVPGFSADLPLLGPVEINKSFEVSEKVAYKGTTVGAGVTAAGGFTSIFFIVDYNYTVSDMDALPQLVSAHTLSSRIGVTTESYKAKGKGSIWIGAMYLNINEKVTGNINLAGIDPEIAAILGDEIGYEMTLGVKEPLNFLVGGSWLINSRMNLMVEAGVGDRSQLMAGFDFRF